MKHQSRLVVILTDTNMIGLLNALLTTDNKVAMCNNQVRNVRELLYLANSLLLPRGC